MKWEMTQPLHDSIHHLMDIFTVFMQVDSIGVSTFTLCSGFGDDTLTATDTMLRASRPMHSEGVEDLSGEVSDW